MRLRRIEIAGFKSFSERAELAFDQGVTAIVGPNGCGKSNVADAIVWALGEQSAKSLRGDRMEDVIFNGSEARKPTATAEVKLSLAGVPIGPRRGRQRDRDASADDGAETETPLLEFGSVREVEVTRRLYRSGESEYLINGEACRLRDIHDLLMDTGLGAKEYAIIEQGKIGQILSSKPVDRRLLIEEAAGVTKYKARRRAAELKLEAARQNLTRIEDIIFEVDKQRQALKRQAAKARRQRRLSEELRRWEQVALARRYRELDETVQATRARLADRRAEEAAAAARVAALEADLDRLRIELAAAEARAAAAREAAHGREMDIDRRQNQIAFGETQIEDLTRREGDIAEEIQTLEARREPARRAATERHQAATRAAADRDQAAATLATVSSAYAGACQVLHELESEVETARRAAYAAASMAAALGHAIDNAVAAQARLAETQRRLAAEMADLRVEQERSRAAQAAAMSALADTRAALAAIAGDRARREAEWKAARAEHERAVAARRAGEQDLAATEARLRSLEELVAARAGFGDAARLVLSGAPPGMTVLGAVADFVEVDQRDERAVEACCGELLQHVLVPSHADAAAGLAFVRVQDAGRCGFLVIGDDGAARDEARPDPPGAGLVSLASLVRASGPGAQAITRAIGEAWVAETFEQALAASALTPAPIVTLDGDIVRGRHVVIGGGRSGARGILETRREIRELGKRLVADREAVQQMGEMVAALEADIDRLSRAIDDLDATAHQREKDIVSLELQVAQAGEEIDRLARKASVLDTEIARAEEERQALEAREAEAREAIARSQADERAAEERLGAAQVRLGEARLRAETVAAQVADARAAHAALVERAAALAAEAARLDEAAADLDERLAAVRQELSQTRDRRREVVAAIADHRARLDTELQDLERLHLNVRAADTEVAGLREQAEGGEARIREARHALEAVRSSVSDLEMARVSAERDLAHLAASCLEATQQDLGTVLAAVEQMEREGLIVPPRRSIEVEEAEEEVTEGEERPEAAVEAEAGPAAPEIMTPDEVIASLRAKIASLGPVNMMAIEQFEELDQRYTFLTVQRKDLTDSIASTGEAIRRIDETSKTRFREAFSAINLHFQETFAKLFGGGRAGLTLIDESDVLESGIEIVAQPPGKRLQNVHLLSGGEKALTAIALMFAIFRYKPSPFCVLDEIDAPLDDANIGRFLEILREMQDETQFILITHNRKTMEIADRLYGVTMEEPGVSKLISVKLN